MITSESNGSQMGVRKRHISVCVLIDALGWKILEERKFLNDLLVYRQP